MSFRLVLAGLLIGCWGATGCCWCHHHRCCSPVTPAAPAPLVPPGAVVPVPPPQ